MRLSKDIPIFFVEFILVFLIVDFYVKPSLETASSIPLTKWASIVVAFAMIVGFFSVSISHFGKLFNNKTNTSDRMMSLLLLVALFATLAAGLIAIDPSYAWADATFQWIFNYIFNAMYTATFSLLALTLLVVSYRHLRPKTWESATFVFAVITVTLKNIPLTSTYLPFVWFIGDWIMRIPVNGTSIGLAIGVFIATAAFTVRFALGRERRMIGGE